MHDAEPLLGELRRLADCPPAPARQVEEVFAEVGRRRQRRRMFAFAVVVLVGGAGVLVPLSEGDGPDSRAIAGPGDTSDDVSTTIDVTPDTDLVDGQTVTLSGPFDPTEVVGVLQCDLAVRAGEESCDLVVLPTHRVSGTNALEVDVRRVIETDRGRTDCASASRRCAVMVETRDGNHAVPISFDGAAPALPQPVVDIEPPDGTGALKVRGSGFAPGTEVLLTLCMPPAVGASGYGEDCDLARGTSASTDDDGRFEEKMLMYSDVLTFGGWQSCEPCVLQAEAAGSGRAEVAMSRGGQDSGRPSVTIDPAPPYQPGQQVRLAGSGFQAGERSIAIAWCGFRTADAATEVQGDASLGYTACEVPAEGLTVTVDNTGRFIIDDFPLPAEPVGPTDCSTESARCGLAWHPAEGSPPAFVTPLEIDAQP